MSSPFRRLLCVAIWATAGPALALPPFEQISSLEVYGIPYVHVDATQCALLPLSRRGDFVETKTRDPSISLVGPFAVGSVRVAGVSGVRQRRHVAVQFVLPFEPTLPDPSRYPTLRQDGRLERSPGLEIVGPLPWLMEALPNCRFEDVPAGEFASYLRNLSKFDRTIQVVVLCAWRENWVGPDLFYSTEPYRAISECEASGRCLEFSEWVVSPPPVRIPPKWPIQIK